MFKHTVIILLIGLSNVTIANSKSEIINQLELIESLKNESLIDQRQYSELIGSLRPQAHQTSVKTLGGTSTINGHIQDVSASNLVSHDITLYEIIANEFSFVTSEITDVDGNYSFLNLQAGTYIVLSGSLNDDYLNYRWQSDSPTLCTSPYSCLDMPTSHIDVVDAATINNIDFTVALGGQMHGSIIDVDGITGVSTLAVRLVNTVPNLIQYYSLFAEVDPLTGIYSIKGIPDGDYRAYLDPRTEFLIEDNLHIPQIFGGPECNDCIRLLRDGSGTVLSINTANTINNIDFSVRIGASISGFLVDNNTFNPMTNIGLILVFNDVNSLLRIGAIPGTDIDPAEDGSYKIGGLLPGNFYIQGGDIGRNFYQRELYNNRPCYYSGCDRGKGDAVILGALENRVGINFLLDKGGKISGMVTDALSGLPIVQNPNDSRLQVEFYNSSEIVVGSAFIKDDGSYISARAMPAGSYSARTGSMFQGALTQPYVNQKYMGIDCAGLACDLSATNIVVTNDTITTGIDYALTTGNSFSGTVTDLASSAPVANVHVLVYKDMGAGVVKFANWATTSDGSNGIPIGQFEVTGLPDGTYFARTGYGSDLPFFVSTFHNIGGPAPIGWIDVLYDGLPCLADCDVTMGTPIILPPPPLKILGANTIDFSLNQGGIIIGQVIDFINQGALKEITINVYNDQGVFMGSSITDNQGNYITRGLPTGTYFLTTSSLDVLLDVKYGNEFCPPNLCNPLNANPILVTESQQTANKDFVLKTLYMHMFSNGFE